MSPIAAMPAIPAASFPNLRRSALQRTNSVVAGLMIIAFLFVLRNLIVSGYVNDAAVNLQMSDQSWRTGIWMSEMVIFLVKFLPEGNLQALALICFGPCIAGLLFGLAYHNLRDSNWTTLGAAGVLAALALNPLMLYTITAASMPSPILVAFVALIPVIRRLEAIGDVQAEVTVGLALPLLFLAGPETTPLILPLAVLSVLWNPDARHDFRAFSAMIVIALLPSTMVAVGVMGFLLHNHLDLATAIAPYAEAFSRFEISHFADGLLPLAVLSPMALVVIYHCAVPDRRRKMWSALCVIALPVYLAIGREVFVWDMPNWVPAATLVASFVAWLSVVRLHRPVRFAALSLLAVSVVIAWTMTGFWDDPAWKAGLLGGPETTWLISTATQSGIFDWVAWPDLSGLLRT